MWTAKLQWFGDTMNSKSKILLGYYQYAANECEIHTLRIIYSFLYIKISDIFFLCS